MIGLIVNNSYNAVMILRWVSSIVIVCLLFYFIFIHMNSILFVFSHIRLYLPMLVVLMIGKELKQYLVIKHCEIDYRKKVHPQNL